MAVDIKLVILGEPKAQKRHRTTRVGGFIRQYDPSSSDKGDFLSIIQSNAPDKPLDQPLRVDCEFYFSRPKSHFKSGKNSHILKDNAALWHTSRNDVDNLIKFVFDALNKVYWRDDGSISECHVRKMYSDKPRTEINITTL